MTRRIGDRVMHEAMDIHAVPTLLHALTMPENPGWPAP